MSGEEAITVDQSFNVDASGGHTCFASNILIGTTSLRGETLRTCPALHRTEVLVKCPLPLHILEELYDFFSIDVRTIRRHVFGNVNAHRAQ